MRLVRAIGGLAAGGVAVFGATGGFDDKTTRNDAGEITEGGGVGAFVLQVGDCIQVPKESMVTSVEGVPCAETHDGQVYDEFNMQDAASIPSNEMVQQEAVDGCKWRWTAALGANYDDMPDYDIYVFRPTSESWTQGDREVSCLVTRIDGGAMTGSLLVSDGAPTPAPPAA